MIAKRGKMNRRTTNQKLAIRKLEQFKTVKFQKDVRFLLDGSIVVRTFCFFRDPLGQTVIGKVKDFAMDMGCEVKEKIWGADDVHRYLKYLRYGKSNVVARLMSLQGRTYLEITIPPGASE